MKDSCNSPESLLGKGPFLARILSQRNVNSPITPRSSISVASVGRLPSLSCNLEGKLSPALSDASSLETSSSSSPRSVSTSPIPTAKLIRRIGSFTQPYTGKDVLLQDVPSRRRLTIIESQLQITDDDCSTTASSSPTISELETTQAIDLSQVLDSPILDVFDASVSEQEKSFAYPGVNSLRVNALLKIAQQKTAFAPIAMPNQKLPVTLPRPKAFLANDKKATIQSLTQKGIFRFRLSSLSMGQYSVQAFQTLNKTLPQPSVDTDIANAESSKAAISEETSTITHKSEALKHNSLYESIRFTSANTLLAGVSAALWPINLYFNNLTFNQPNNAKVIWSQWKETVGPMLPSSMLRSLAWTGSVYAINTAVNFVTGNTDTKNNIDPVRMMFAGILASYATNPLVVYLLRKQLKLTSETLPKFIKQTLASNDWSLLMRGAQANALRSGFGDLGSFTFAILFNQKLKTMFNLSEENVAGAIATAWLAGIAATAVSSIISHPFDVLARFQQRAPEGKQPPMYKVAEQVAAKGTGRYRSGIFAEVRAVSQSILAATRIVSPFYDGFLLSVLRVGTMAGARLPALMAADMLAGKVVEYCQYTQDQVDMEQNETLEHSHIHLCIM